MDQAVVSLGAGYFSEATRSARQMARWRARMARKPEPAIKGIEAKPNWSTHCVWQGMAGVQEDACSGKS